jgi:hypothetical protein
VFAGLNGQRNQRPHSKDRLLHCIIIARHQFQFQFQLRHLNKNKEKRLLNYGKKNDDSYQVCSSTARCTTTLVSDK